MMVIKKIKIDWNNLILWVVNLFVNLSLIIIRKDKTFMTLLDDVRETEDINYISMTATTESNIVEFSNPKKELQIPKPKTFEEYRYPNTIKDTYEVVIVNRHITHDYLLYFRRSAKFYSSTLNL